MVGWLAVAVWVGLAAQAPHPSTLEDLFGTTGNKFAGAIGFMTREANASPEAVAGYGLGIDDVVVEWREFTLEEVRQLIGRRFPASQDNPRLLSQLNRFEID